MLSRPDDFVKMASEGRTGQYDLSWMIMMIKHSYNKKNDFRIENVCVLYHSLNNCMCCYLQKHIIFKFISKYFGEYKFV